MDGWGGDGWGGLSLIINSIIVFGKLHGGFVLYEGQTVVECTCTWYMGYQKGRCSPYQRSFLFGVRKSWCHIAESPIGHEGLRDTNAYAVPSLQMIRI